MVTIGNVTNTTTAYQGSGLDKAPASKVVNMPKPAETGENTKQNAQSTHTAHASTLEVTEVQQNESLKRAVEQINKKANNSEAVFGFHEATNRVMIKIVDKQTKEVIKEFPPEETLDMIAKAWELAGLMVDEKR